MSYPIPAESGQQTCEHSPEVALDWCGKCDPDPSAPEVEAVAGFVAVGDWANAERAAARVLGTND